MKNEIKVGSRVRCVKKNFFADPGEIGTVARIDINDSECVAVEWDNNVGGHKLGMYGAPECKNGHGEWMYASQLELITEESDMKFKIGDRVRVVDEGEIWHNSFGTVQKYAPNYAGDYEEHYSLSNGRIGVVVGYEDGSLLNPNESNYIIYSDNHVYVISESGIELTDTKPSNTAM